MFKTFLLMPLAAVFQGGMQEAIAQQDTVRKVRVEIVTTENGETRRITKEFDADSEVAIQDALKELGILDHINLHDDGENVTIDIRRSGGRADDDVFMHVAPVPPLPPLALGSEPTAYLGVSTRTVDADLAKELQLPVRSGVLVDQVVTGSAAEKAGLVKGDVIAAVDGQTLNDSDELIARIRAHRPGDSVKVTWYHAGKKKNATVALGERRTFAGPEHGSPEFDWESYMGDGPWSEAPRAFLGVTPGDDEGAGATIGSVQEGTAAERMGLESGDRVVRIGTEAIDDFEDLSATVRSMRPGDAVEITVLREGEELRLSGTLGERRMDRTYRFDRRGGPSTDDLLEFHGVAPADRDELQREMDQLRREMEELRRELRKDLRTETRITIESMPLSVEEKALLKSKGVDHLDAELKVGDMRVFPNPSNGFFRIQFDVPTSGDLFVNVHDATGEKVYQERITGFKGRYERTLDLTDKATGTYFLVIEQNGRSTAQKLVKQ